MDGGLNQSTEFDFCPWLLTKFWANFGCKVRFVGALDGGEGGVDLEHLADRHQTLHLSVPADMIEGEAAMD